MAKEKTPETKHNGDVVKKADTIIKNLDIAITKSEIQRAKHSILKLNMDKHFANKGLKEFDPNPTDADEILQIEGHKANIEGADRDLLVTNETLAFLRETLLLQLA